MRRRLTTLTDEPLRVCGQRRERQQIEPVVHQHRFEQRGVAAAHELERRADFPAGEI